MSGKAPPKGPRALLNSLPKAGPSSSPPSTSTVPNSFPRFTTGTGATPPTGPRSLVNGSLGFAYNSQGGYNAGKSVGALTPTRPFVNGHAHAPNALRVLPTPPTGPKGKSIDITSNGRKLPTGPSALTLSPSTSLARPRVPPSPISEDATPRAPSTSPPPAPPSPAPPAPPVFNAPTPPPPPPGTPPPDLPPPIPHLAIPIKLRNAHPQEPRLAPPPLPPPPPAPPPEPKCLPVSHALPAPPSSSPPPLPPEIVVPSPRVSAPSLASSSHASTSSNLADPRLHVLPPPPPPPPVPQKPKTPPPLPEYVIATTTLVNGISKTLYSLRPPPAWPPADFASGRNFKVLYDSAVDKDKDGKLKGLMELVRASHPVDEADGPDHSPAKDQEKERKTERIKSKGKGRSELLMRFNGETVAGEPDTISRDPRKASGFKRSKARGEFHILKYEVCFKFICPRLLLIITLLFSLSMIRFSALALHQPRPSSCSIFPSLPPMHRSRDTSTSTVRC